MPWGVLTGADLAIMFAADQLVHAGTRNEPRDRRRRLSRPRPRIDAVGERYVDAHREPGMFGPERLAPAEADDLDRLAAFVGRRVGS